MISKELLQQVAVKKGLRNKEYIEKDYFQELILFNLYKKTNSLIFKGGTALYKLYSFQRFSEDLDFSLIKEDNVENIINEAVNNIKEAKIKEIKKIKNSVLVKISFNGILTKYNTIRVDINIKNKVLDNFDVKLYNPNYIDINPFSLRVMSLKEITTEKIHALFVREKARDLYDLFFLLRLTNIDKELLKRKFKLLEIDFDFKELKKKIERLNELWIQELKPFIIGELPDFKVVKDFTLNNLKSI